MTDFLNHGGVLVAADAIPLLRKGGLESFRGFMECSTGEQINRKRGRRVVRLQLNGRVFYLKRNYFHWVEFLKTLSRFRLPPRSARREWQSIMAVRQAGIPTVPPIAMGERAVFGVETASFIMTEELYDAEPLEKVIRRSFAGGPSKKARTDKTSLVLRVAHLARRLHHSGMYHQDFYLGHVFLGRDGILSLIDLQRLRRRRTVPRHYLIKDLGQLAYSADVTGGISRTDRLRFFLAYLGIDRLDARHKALARRILAKARRIDRHTVKLLARRRQRGEIP